MSTDAPLQHQPHLDTPLRTKWYEVEGSEQFTVNSSPTGLVHVSVSCTLGKIFPHLDITGTKLWQFLRRIPQKISSSVRGPMNLRFSIDYVLKRYGNVRLWPYFSCSMYSSMFSVTHDSLHKTYPVLIVAYLNVYRFVDDFSFCFLMCKVKIAFVSLYVSFICYFVFA